ncbi:MAG: hypothetical protein IKQ01_03315 [Bacteroidales bacterium]|nr:hypothetical protein [Bacteroidales bacterium]
MNAILTPVLFSDLYGSAGNLTAYHRDGRWLLRKRSQSPYIGTQKQEVVLSVHRRAISAWQSLSEDCQRLWGVLADNVEPHQPPFDHTTRISGYNLFVSAYRGFATLGNEHVPEPRAFEKFPPFAVDVGGASVVEGLLVLPVSVFIAAAFVPERYRLLAKVQLTQPGKGRNPGKMRNVLADRPCGSSSVNLFIDPGIWGLNLQQYQVHARFILLDTVTGYRSQFIAQSMVIS